MGLAGYVDPGPTQERIQYLHDRRGIPFWRIAARAGLHADTVSMHYRGIYRGATEYQWVEMATERAISRARFRPEDGAWFPSVGIRRRLQALFVAGYTTVALAGELPVSGHKALHDTLSGTRSKKLVTAGLATAVIALYDRWSMMPPESAGVPVTSARRCRTIGRNRGYVPAGCWDPDTIDDPDAEPEWTGECGTERGYQIHYRESIPYCGRCQRAHRDYKDGLSGANLVKQARDADIAEMLDDGVDVAQIAHELGVSERTVVRRKKERAA